MPRSGPIWTVPLLSSRSLALIFYSFLYGHQLTLGSTQSQEYFAKQVGLIARTTLQYNANGTSRGIATVIFKKPGMANKAAAELNGLLVDKRPMKVG